MSESDEHREIVMSIFRNIRDQHGDIQIQVDIQKNPGDPVPQIINGCRPDIYAYNLDKRICIIGEAKTIISLGNKHTHKQLTTFVRYLEKRQRGIFILGTSGDMADHAKTLLRFIQKELKIKNTRLRLFDGCDFWELEEGRGIRWHLS